MAYVEKIQRFRFFKLLLIVGQLQVFFDLPAFEEAISGFVLPASRYILTGSTTFRRQTSNLLLAICLVPLCDGVAYNALPAEEKLWDNC